MAAAQLNQMQLLQINAELYGIAFTMIWSTSTPALITAFKARWGIQSNAIFDQLFHLNVLPQFIPHWVTSTLYPHTPSEPTLSDRARKRRVHGDIATIHQRFTTHVNDVKLALLAKFPKNDSRIPVSEEEDELELLIPLPPNKGPNFHLFLAELLKQQREVKCSYPAAIFL
eukprot:scaffold7473_cov118-Skeletonema_menzelii.AAC.3